MAPSVVWNKAQTFSFAFHSVHAANTVLDNRSKCYSYYLIEYSCESLSEKMGVIVCCMLLAVFPSLTDHLLSIKKVPKLKSKCQSSGLKKNEVGDYRMLKGCKMKSLVLFSAGWWGGMAGLCNHVKTVTSSKH